MVYRGRFAPTPSGPLHFGSLVAAAGSYLEAKRHAGEWWLRIDDLDPPRVQPGATDSILRCLERYGFQWDGPVIHQSARRLAYHAALHRLWQRGVIYPCACSRTQISQLALPGSDGPVYPGTCRQGMGAASKARALRVLALDTAIELDDEVQGTQRRVLDVDLGDFVLYRNDGVYSFHLASVVDDAASGMTHIVRGADLLESSIRQIYLQRLLGLATPRYVHLPVALNISGEKLSKQTRATELSLSHPQSRLVQALRFLGQAPPRDLANAGIEEVWGWAISHWNLSAVPRIPQRSVEEISFTNSERSSGIA